MRPNRRLVATRPLESRIRRKDRRDLESYKCVLCKGFHGLRFYRKFLSMTIKQREKVVDRQRCCENCLARSHDLRACSSVNTCRKCDEYHHTLLHPTPKRTVTKDHKPKPTKRVTGSNQPSTSVSTSSSPPTPSTSATVPTTAILEAIKSLANVLCTSSHTASTA